MTGRKTSACVGQQSNGRAIPGAWALVAVVALVARVAVAFPVMVSPERGILTDDYIAMGVSWLSTGLQPHPAYPPLYTLVAGFVGTFLPGSPVRWLVLMNLVLGVGGVLAVGGLVWVLTRSMRGAFASAALMALDPNILVHGSLVSTETLFGTLLAIWLLLMAMTSRSGAVVTALGAGVALGLLLLTRAAGVVLLPVLLLFAAWELRVGRPRPALGLLVVGVVGWSMLLPFAKINHSRYGEFSYTNSGDLNLAALYIGPLKSRMEGQPEAASLEPFKDQLDLDEDNPFVLASEARAVAVQWALDHPGAVLSGTLRGTVLRAISPSRSAWARVLGISRLGGAFTALLVGVRLGILLLVGMGMAAALRERDFSLLFPALVGCALYVSLGPLADGRFLVSCLPALLPLGGMALARGRMVANPRRS